jgi:hypothetical protein
MLQSDFVDLVGRDDGGRLAAEIVSIDLVIQP